MLFQVHVHRARFFSSFGKVSWTHCSITYLTILSLMFLFVLFSVYHHGPACPGLVGDSPPSQALSRPLTNPSLPQGLTRQASTSCRQLKYSFEMEPNERAAEQSGIQTPRKPIRAKHFRHSTVGQHSVRYRSQA